MIDKDTIPLPTQEDEEKEMENLITWLSKFGVKKRLQIGYRHTLAAIKFSKLKKVENDRPG
ncbi:MAG: hypothetical protein AB1422_07745 [bacterium]